MCLYVLHNLFCMDFPGHHVLHAQAAAQDPYKTLGEQGVDVKGEVQYTVAEFSVGTKFLGRKPKDMAFQREKTCGFHWPQWVLISFDGILGVVCTRESAGRCGFLCASMRTSGHA